MPVLVFLVMAHMIDLLKRINMTRDQLDDIRRTIDNCLNIINVVMEETSEPQYDVGELPLSLSEDAGQAILALYKECGDFRL
jgi:hypothetical protein